MLNEVRLIGNVGSDPWTGNNVAKISVATTESWKDKNGQWQEKTEWHNVVCFGYANDYVRNNVAKGMLVLVLGSMIYGKYTNQEGVEVKTAEVKAMKVRVLNKRDKVAGNDNYPDIPGGYGEPTMGDDVPF